MSDNWFIKEQSHFAGILFIQWIIFAFSKTLFTKRSICFNQDEFRLWNCVEKLLTIFFLNKCLMDNYSVIFINKLFYTLYQFVKESLPHTVCNNSLILEGSVQFFG